MFVVCCVMMMPPIIHCATVCHKHLGLRGLRVESRDSLSAWDTVVDLRVFHHHVHEYRALAICGVTSSFSTASMYCTEMVLLMVVWIGILVPCFTVAGSVSAALRFIPRPMRRSPHVAEADEAHPIGPPRGARERFRRVDRLLEVAAQSGADAVHPGYGFLSENAAFAEAVERAGLTWYWPSAKIHSRHGRQTAGT